MLEKFLDQVHWLEPHFGYSILTGNCPRQQPIVIKETREREILYYVLNNKLCVIWLLEERLIKERKGEGGPCALSLASISQIWGLAIGIRNDSA